MKPTTPFLASLLVGLAGCADDEAPPPSGPGCDGAAVLELEALYTQFESEVYPLLTRAPSAGGCASCHTPATTLPVVIFPDARVTMDALWADGYLGREQDTTVVSVLQREDAKRMPLGGAPWDNDDIAVVERFVCNLEASGLEPPVLCEGEPDPGNVLIRRLTNYEYDHTVGDATGDATGPGAGFAPDQPSYGFDNVSSGQQISLGHIEQYHGAAAAIAEATLLVPAPIDRGYQAEDLSAFLYNGEPLTNPAHGWAVEGQYFHFQLIRAYVTTGLAYFPYDGTYTITVQARGKHDIYETDTPMPDGFWTLVDDDVAPQLRIEVDGIEVDVVDIIGIPYDHDNFGPWRVITLDQYLEKGMHTVRAWLDNATLGNEHKRDVRLEVDFVDVDGPAPGELPPPDQERIARFLICNGEASGCAEETVEHALTTLWRRPATSAEVARYLGLIDDALAAQETFEEGVEAVLEAALLSPNFLFRPEIDPDPAVPETRPLEPFELATRLSYFLWASAPDAELATAAGDGTLIGDAGLEAQMERMLEDPRATALTKSFAAQWLHLGPMQQMAPSADVFPEFDDELRDAMIAELQLVLQEIFEEDRSILDIVDTDFTYVNDRLAAHYGLDVSGSAFQRVDVTGTPRGGLFESAGFLTLTSHPARTSPTRRGKWILEQILCQPPGEPPPNADTTVEVGSADSLKEFLAQHREDAACAGCHAAMDGLGITLERFDPIGRWRDIDDWGNPVDPAGVLASGEELADHAAMMEHVKSHPGFEACVTRKMLVYALGRDPQMFDSCAVDAVQADFAAAGHSVRALVRAVVMSALFRQRRPEKPGEYDDLNQSEEE